MMGEGRVSCPNWCEGGDEGEGKREKGLEARDEEGRKGEGEEEERKRVRNT